MKKSHKKILLWCAFAAFIFIWAGIVMALWDKICTVKAFSAIVKLNSSWDNVIQFCLYVLPLLIGSFFIKNIKSSVEMNHKNEAIQGKK